MEWIWGLLGSLLIAGVAYWKGSLSLSGTLAAVLLGTTMFALGSFAWAGTLIAFFISSTLLSKFKHKRKARAESGYAKSGRRDAGQVAANGGIGLLLCLGHAWLPHPAWWAIFVGVMATVNADTWATEIGGLSKTEPRSIVSGKRVSAGTSGGVTGFGLLASLLGGLFIGLAGWLCSQMGQLETGISFLPLLLLAALSGLLGSLIDSWLGATLQVMFRCDVCGRTIEKQVHCEQRARQVRGMSGMTNDYVNAVSSLAGGLICLVLSCFVS
ncbi:DUF92 domain-containing protein [Paenibacillus sp. SYP-B3998]|uniref:DUF92 domain-containing protein n=1 Tax=Paenibacillus sp. SYP-B3998 TaxID=2678564 RepID=UPI00196800C2|nr:DUF92 domain-containing protein [Paenibacillus sp. SYP-B3998]